MLVRTNNATLCRDVGSFDGPNVEVMVRPISRDMYVVATKKRTENTAMG